MPGLFKKHKRYLYLRKMHDAATERNGDGLSAIPHLEFGEDVFHVGFYGLFGDAQGVADLLVRLAEDQQADDVPLAS